MFAFFNMGFQEMIVLGVIPVTAVVLILVFNRRGTRRRSYDPDQGPTPLERAKYAAALLTPSEREELRRSLEQQRPRPPAGGEGVTS